MNETELFPLPERVQALVPGRRYTVEFSDCCVSGHFTGVFTRVEYVPNKQGDPPNYPSRLIFDCAAIGVDDSWTAIEPADDPADSPRCPEHGDSRMWCVDGSHEIGAPEWATNGEPRDRPGYYVFPGAIR